MALPNPDKITITNDKAFLTLDFSGGAITSFHLKDEVNPLSFAFSPDQMPDNNKGGACYKGHFLCLGRWGEPSTGEMKAGMPNHGQIANLLWQRDSSSPNDTLKMGVVSPLEGLEVVRTVRMDKESPVYAVKEVVKNINPLGRLYNMVQHPTLAQPFLNEDTIVNCNAGIGFNYLFSKNPETMTSQWPYGICEDNSVLNLSRPEKPYNSVFSYVVKQEEEIGWISAYSPTFNLILGYLWRREDYPWINVWQDWVSGKIRYRGIEFGTTGIHQPFHRILEHNKSHLFGEKTFYFIDAGEVVSRSYVSFLFKCERDFGGVEKIWFDKEKIFIKENNADNVHTINNRLINSFSCLETKL
jgi:hypothetical protein